jgi:hypothetical protein
MNYDDLIKKITKKSITNLGLEFLEKTEGTTSNSVKTVKHCFKIKNKIKDKYARSLQCEFVTYENRLGVYLEICWYRPPACRMICFNEKVNEVDPLSQLIAAVESSVFMLEQMLKDN